MRKYFEQIEFNSPILQEKVSRISRNAQTNSNILTTMNFTFEYWSIFETTFSEKDAKIQSAAKLDIMIAEQLGSNQWYHCEMPRFVLVSYWNPKIYWFQFQPTLVCKICTVKFVGDWKIETTCM